VTGASGTPAFSPPEQLLGEPQEAPADCFSLGAIVVFVLTGQAPFGEHDPTTILARELAGNIDLTPFAPEIAAWLRRAFSPDPNDRFAEAAVMQTEWRNAAGAVLERERRVPWWRRIFGADEAGDGWWREGAPVGE
jgi:eukaryotic-like serine/threonine-protein kinase